jgi:hypothetical protein
VISSPAGYALAGAAALLAGIANAIAGGGSLLSFPALVAAGLPPVIANLTNTVAMCPGYLGATLAQRRDLAGQSRRAWAVLPVSAAGGVGGAWLLLHTGESAFGVVVPFLLVFAAALLAGQGRLKRWLLAPTAAAAAAAAPTPRAERPWLATVPIAAAATYGGYFGAGMGVIVLAALAVVLDDTLTRVNALKQTVSLVVNVAAAVVFVASGRVAWDATLVMALCALAGGAIGGRIASRVPPSVLRAVVVVIALAVAAYYFWRLA